ncbi:MAG: hypothetical protein AAGH89_11135 [Verrucomicrobiota bacterium]
MKKLTWICAIILIAIGTLGFFGWELIGASKQSVTAAIPAFVGILVGLGALIANKNHKVGMHISVLFGLLGLLAGLGRIIPTAAKGELDFGASSTLLILSMTVVCLVYTVLAVRSFIAARRG